MWRPQSELPRPQPLWPASSIIEHPWLRDTVETGGYLNADSGAESEVIVHCRNFARVKEKRVVLPIITLPTAATLLLVDCKDMFVSYK